MSSLLSSSVPITQSVQKYGTNDQITLTFVEALVELVTGVPLNEIPQEVLEEITFDVLDLYVTTMKEHVMKTQGKRAVLQYKIFESRDDLDIINQLDTLPESLLDAHQFFISTVTSI